MRFAYDPATDSLYIHLSDRAAADSDEVTDGVMLDDDAAGNGSAEFANQLPVVSATERRVQIDDGDLAVEGKTPGQVQR